MVIREKNQRLTEPMRTLHRSITHPTYDTFKKAIQQEPPEICANAMVTMITICPCLLSRKNEQPETVFFKKVAWVKE